MSHHVLLLLLLFARFFYMFHADDAHRQLRECALPSRRPGPPVLHGYAAWRHMARVVAAVAGVAILFSTSGCSSLFSEGAAAGAGVGGAAIAAKVTRNPTVAAGIGLGTLAAAQAGVKYVEKIYHEEQQDRIAAVAGPLSLGKTAKWESLHSIEIEPDARGRVTVSRLISTGELNCKEIVFSVDEVTDDKPTSSFYTATICEQAGNWKWASAEPATARWGSLQ